MNMLLSNYKTACKEFAESSKEWWHLNDTTYYTQQQHGSPCWKESCDNDGGGFSVKWAFHLEKAEINKRVENEFFTNLKEFLDSLDCCENAEHARDMAISIFGE